MRNNETQDQNYIHHYIYHMNTFPKKYSVHYSNQVTLFIISNAPVEKNLVCMFNHLYLIGVQCFLGSRL